MTTSHQQASNDDRDNSRVGIFLVVMFALVFLGALLYFFAVVKRAEGPVHEAPPPAAQSEGTGSGIGQNGSAGTSADSSSAAPQAAPVR
jgi:hypothetical protein